MEKDRGSCSGKLPQQVFALVNQGADRAVLAGAVVIRLGGDARCAQHQGQKQDKAQDAGQDFSGFIRFSHRRRLPSDSF